MPHDSSASSFASQMAFKKSWRPYQARVLERLSHYLRDQHFHLVAAPGSGKTVLGLEIIRRLNRNTLVLTPTLAIREQWVDRLTRDYLGPVHQGDGENIPWLSRDLSSPGQLTVATYQSLSSEFRKRDGTDLVRKLRETGVSVLVVDEAHHLRAVWWKCLSAVKDALDGVYVVSLTATPPIDVLQAEWNRYAGFCGQVDEEVGVPELVAEGNLCPHQDYILFSTPDQNDVAELRRFCQGVASFVLDRQLDMEFAERLIKFPNWITSEDTGNRRYLRDNQEFFFALAIYLQRVGGRIPNALKEAYSIDGEELPELDVEWFEVLLQGLLYDFRGKIDLLAERKPEDIEIAFDEESDTMCLLLEEEKEQINNAHEIVSDLKRLQRRLYELGAIERKRVVLKSTEENEKLLQNSPAKLHSIADIIEHELTAQGVLMRAVILTDHIRKDAFPDPDSASSVEEAPLAKLGVVPIFELLRRMRLPGLFPGILSGSVMIIPRTAESEFRCIAQSIGIDEVNLHLKPLPHDPDFFLLEIRESDRYRAVAAMTDLFSQGSINCLVGTASLLGEGWDSPELNTLVLASVIGSFVMSNQMRGRAIRSSAESLSKTANIWHVATIPPDLSSEHKGKETSYYQYDSGEDYRKLLRRFKAFYGIGLNLDKNGDALIENGMARLGLGERFVPAKLDRINQRMQQCAEDRIEMEMIWRRAIPPKEDGRFLRPMRSLATPRRMAASKFIATLGGKSETGARAFIANWLERRRLSGIAHAVLLTMGEIDSSERGDQTSIDLQSKREIRIMRFQNRFHVTAPELENYVQGKFIEALGEFFDLFSSPRYLIHQKGRWVAIPKTLGSNKDDAARFSRNLRKQGFGRHKVFFVHGREGKDFLLEARKQSLLRHFEFRTETRVRWEVTDE